MLLKIFRTYEAAKDSIQVKAHTTALEKHSKNAQHM